MTTSFYPTRRSSSITLDTILSAAFHFTVKWSGHLQSNKARDLLRYLVCRLYKQGDGNLFNAELTLAQTTIARRLGISRQWVGELIKRLEEGGWLEHTSEKLDDGTNGSSIWRIGRRLKYLIVKLTKSKQRKTPTRSDDKSALHLGPLGASLQEQKKASEVRARENEPPSEATLKKIPLLGTWLGRGTKT